MRNWTVYILQCGDGTLYTGITTNIDRRVQQHKNGTASKYTASRGVKSLVYTEPVEGRSVALKREHTIRQLSRKAKMNLIEAKT